MLLFPICQEKLTTSLGNRLRNDRFTQKSKLKKEDQSNQGGNDELRLDEITIDKNSCVDIEYLDGSSSFDESKPFDGENDLIEYSVDNLSKSRRLTF